VAEVGSHPWELCKADKEEGGHPGLVQQRVRPKTKFKRNILNVIEI